MAKVLWIKLSDKELDLYNKINNETNGLVYEYFIHKKYDEKINIEIKPYSDKSFLIIGEDTKKHKEKLKELGGKWNSTLKGWIYSNKNEQKVREWMSECVAVEEYFSMDEN